MNRALSQTSHALFVDMHKKQDDMINSVTV